MQPGPERFFPASYDSTTKIVTALVAVVLAVVTAVTRNPLVASAAAILLALSYAYSPRGYFYTGQAIIIKRLLKNATFPLDGLRELRRATADDLSGAVRLWGNGGIFGYYGLFQTSRLGRCKWYVTNRSNTVVAVTEARTAVFSPDDVDGFAALAGASALPGTVGPFAAPVRRSRLPAIIAVSFGVLVVGFVLFALAWSPGPPAYTLTADRLTIHDHFYPVTLEARDVDVAQIRVVDLATDTHWRPVERTNGFANSHYQSGWFKVAGDEKARLYRAGGNRLVLFPPKGNGAPVLLQTPDPDAFAAEVRRLWSRAP